ncbi:MAG: hypothetical protein EBZ74_10705 [Planctomycetia bacterium]|nr:hypothetical protein [Planctomycetia bacterium]
MFVRRDGTAAAGDSPTFPPVPASMRFLDDYLDATRRPQRSAAPPGAIARPDRRSLEAHLARRRYGRFTLTEAVRPSWQLDVVPQAGYRLDAYTDPRTGARLPALIASVSSEQLFDAFLGLLEPLGDTCDVVLETSHDAEAAAAAAPRREAAREGIERLVLESVLWEFEDLLLNDGCSGIAVLHPELQLEVQLDEHKLLVVYAHDRRPFERILAGHGIERHDRMRFISQGEHLHTSHSRFARMFDSMAGLLGAA